MIDGIHFENMERKHGAYASWAVWASAGLTPKSNIGDMTVFDRAQNPTLLRSINPNVVMVGLNGSRSVSFDQPFRNFHDQSPRAQDFKIRYAFTDTPYYGAYMTDIIKRLEMVSSKVLREHLRCSPELVKRNVEVFLDELYDLAVPKALVLAFGVDAHSIIQEHVPARAYGTLVRLTHYSHQIGKEKYRETVLAQIAAGCDAPPT